MGKMKTLIVGLGNQLMQDDGVGIYISDKIIKDEYYDVFDCGPDAFRILNYLNNHKRIIIIDAIDIKLKPGTIICLKEEGLFKFNDLTRSVHQISALEALKIMKKIEPSMDLVELFFIGIQIEDINLNQMITEEVKKSADIIIERLNKKEYRDLFRNYSN